MFTVSTVYKIVIQMCPPLKQKNSLVVYHFRKFRLGCKWNTIFDSFHWKIPGTNGNSEKVFLFSRLGVVPTGNSCFAFHMFRSSFRLFGSLGRVNHALRVNPEMLGKW